MRFSSWAVVVGFVVPLPGLGEDTPRYNRDVRPILSERCFACHGPDAAHREADLRLDVAESATESAIVPGRPDGSELIARITSTDPDVRMPPAEHGEPLSAEEVSILRRWIETGARYERHWSFLPPQRPATPKVERTEAVRNGIDPFVLARLEAEGLAPSPEADRYSLIRRVTLDLTGLPPTPAEVEAFVRDDSDDAYERVVDRLLESPRYAEHMARSWLDAARYADTNGYQYDLEREQWVWRDWVIHAYDTNMPFDRFTVEQLAGDLLPDATDRQRLATAFHRNHPITIEGGVIDEEYRTEYVVDRVVTTSTVWMGLTMTCARCHDHKFDPVTQRDFYRLFAFFNNVPEKGHNGFDPKRTIDSPLGDAERERTTRALERVVAAIDHELAEGAPLDEWEARVAADVDPWTKIVPTSATARGGTTFDERPDQSLLATGANPATNVYEFTIASDEPVRAIRIEALTDPSHVGGGTGRGSNGNFVLSEVDVAFPSAKEGEFTAIEIGSATADYEQNGYPVAAAIDGRFGRGGWAVDGNTRRENRSAAFVLAKPIAPSTRLRVRLHFTWGGSHAIGRVRLATTPRPPSTVPADVTTALGIDSDKRSPDQRRKVREYLAGRFGSPELKQLTERATELRRGLAAAGNVPATMIMADLPTPRTTNVLTRGEYDKPGDPVTAGTPSALPAMPDDLPRNRLGLARWLTDPAHPLTARVAVNRHWHRLFGTGLVETVEDFGAQGAWPSHPELLDWLAVEFVESGWDVKRLMRTIVTSGTYRQSGRLTPALLERDPDNRLLARGPRLRLDAEVIRDSALRAGGLLSDRVGGPSVFPYHPSGLWQEINNRPGYSRTYKRDSGEKLYRRSLYTFWKRTVPPPSMAAFDAPEREYCVVRRSRTNTPLQAFVLLHDPQFVEAARHLAVRVLREGGESNDERLAHAFRLCFARPPEPAELRELRSILERRLERYRADPEAAARVLGVGASPVESTVPRPELAAWTTVARVVLNLGEFVTKP